MGLGAFAERLADHRIKELCTLWIPARCVVKEKADPKLLFRLDLRILCERALSESARDWRRVEKYISEHGDKDSIRRGKKTAVATLRDLLLYSQIARSACISDYEVGNAIQQD